MAIGVGVVFLLLALAGGYELVRMQTFARRFPRGVTPKDLPTLRAAMKDYNWAIRNNAIQYMMGLRSAGAAALPDLLDALDDSSPYVRASAAGTILCVAPNAPEVVPKLLHLLDDPDPIGRHGAVYFFSQVEGSKALPAKAQLAGLLQDPKYCTMAMGTLAIGTLAKIGDPASDVVPQMIAGLAKCPLMGRAHYAESLAKFGPLANAATPQLRAFCLDQKMPAAQVKKIENAISVIEGRH
jgi:HEAT repeat protein